MPRFIIRLVESVYYEAHIDAPTEDEARTIADQQLYDDELETYEVDSSAMTIESIEVLPESRNQEVE